MNLGFGSNSLLLLAFVFPPHRNTVGSRTLTTPRPHLALIGLSTRWRAPLPSRLLVFTSCGPAFLPTPPPLLPSCLPISLFSIDGVRILLLGSRSPIRHYYRHRAPFGVLVFPFKKQKKAPVEGGSGISRPCCAASQLNKQTNLFAIFWHMGSSSRGHSTGKPPRCAAASWGSNWTRTRLRRVARRALGARASSD